MVKFIAVRNVTRAISETAREFVRSNGVAPKDAIHVATAVSSKVSTFETFDRHRHRSARPQDANPAHARSGASRVRG